MSGGARRARNVIKFVSCYLECGFMIDNIAQLSVCFRDCRDTAPDYDNMNRSFFKRINSTIYIFEKVKRTTVRNLM